MKAHLRKLESAPPKNMDNKKKEKNQKQLKLYRKGRKKKECKQRKYV